MTEIWNFFGVIRIIKLKDKIMLHLKNRYSKENFDITVGELEELRDIITKFLEAPHDNR